MNLTINIIWTVIRTALSVSLLALSSVSFINTYTAFAKEKRAILTVDSSLPVNNGYGITKSYPVVTLQVPNTPPRSLSVSGLFWDEQYKAGDYILVRYNPDVPTGIRVDTWMSNGAIWMFPVVTGLVGIVVLPTIEKFKKEPKLKKEPKKPPL